MQYAFGTAQHETDFTLNEVDVEMSGFCSKGIFQLSEEEAGQAHNPGANLLDLDDSCQVLMSISAHRLDMIAQEAKLVASNPFPPDAWAYLVIAHNQGPMAAVKTIRRYGLDWAAYKQRNAITEPKLLAYGDDCISGGAKFPEGG